MNRIALLLLCLIVLNVHAQDLSLYEEHSFSSEGEALHYRLLLPEDYDESESYPLILFLHGAGERGTDNEKQLTHGAGMFLQPEVREAFPAIIIFPQCPQDEYWANVHLERTEDGLKLDFSKDMPPSRPMKLVLDLMDEWLAKPQVDERRVYVMGLSMGGMGTFEILARRPEMFAAAVPICGGGNPEYAERYAKNTAIWIFHGAKDQVVAPHFSTTMLKAIQDAGGKPAITVYPEANHNSWDPAFKEPGLLPWLFSKSTSK